MHLKIVLIISLILLVTAPCLADVAPGRIAVHSTPAGALACVDNVTCDAADTSFTVAGNAWHSVVVSQNGYRSWSDRVYVTADQMSQVDAYLDLDPEATAINVSVNPGNVRVCLDNNDCRADVGAAGSTGRTRFTGVSPGYHTVSVQGPAGYDDGMQLVKVDLGKTSEVSLELSVSATPVVTPGGEVDSTGTVRIYVDRTGSTICLDTTDCYVNVGGSSGTGTGTVVFSEVTTSKAHIVSITCDGYRSVTTPITVSKDMITTVDVKLQPATGSTISSTPSAGASPAGQNTPAPVAPTTRSASSPVAGIGAIVICSALFLWRAGRR